MSLLLCLGLMACSTMEQPKVTQTDHPENERSPANAFHLLHELLDLRAAAKKGIKEISSMQSHLEDAWGNRGYKILAGSLDESSNFARTISIKTDYFDTEGTILVVTVFRKGGNEAKLAQDALKQKKFLSGFGLRAERSTGMMLENSKTHWTGKEFYLRLGDLTEKKLKSIIDSVGGADSAVKESF